MRFAPALALAGAAAVVATAAYGHGPAQGVPRSFHPQTGAAVGKRDVWILGWYRRGAAQRLALVRSTDAGKTFVRVGLPPLSLQGETASLTFVNAHLGYLVSPRGRLYVTHDGGTNWRPFGPKGVREVAMGGGEIYVLSKNRFERSPLGRSAWQAVSLPVRYRFLVSLAARGKKVWLLGSTRHIRAGDITLRSSDRGTTFKKSHAPCFPELEGMLVPAGDGVVWAVCPSGMMAGLSLSTNGGRTFPRFRSFHDPGGINLPALTNGAGIFPTAARAAVLYRGVSGPLFRTTDKGKRWSEIPRTGRLEQLFWLRFATSRVGLGLFTARSHPNQASLWRTTDGGATWHAMPIR